MKLNEILLIRTWRPIRDWTVSVSGDDCLVIIAPDVMGMFLFVLPYGNLVLQRHAVWQPCPTENTRRHTLQLVVLTLGPLALRWVSLWINGSRFSHLPTSFWVEGPPLLVSSANQRDQKGRLTAFMCCRIIWATEAASNIQPEALVGRVFTTKCRWDENTGQTASRIDSKRDASFDCQIRDDSVF